MAKIDKKYQSGDEFTPDSVNEIIAAVNKNVDDIVATKTYVDKAINTAIGNAIKGDY